jgi:hypothetical protein
MDGWMDGWMGGWVDGWMGGWVDGRTDGWIDGWMLWAGQVECIDEMRNTYKILLIFHCFYVCKVVFRFIVAWRRNVMNYLLVYKKELGASTNQEYNR